MLTSSVHFIFFYPRKLRWKCVKRFLNKRNNKVNYADRAHYREWKVIPAQKNRLLPIGKKMFSKSARKLEGIHTRIASTC